jgi:hypothetical protein
LWVLWFYVLWRYWQSFSAVNKKPTKTRYREIKKLFVQRIAVERGLLPYRDGRAQLLPGEPEGLRAWMPHDEEKTIPQGAKVLLVTNMVDQAGTGAISQRNIEVDFSNSKMRTIRLRSIFYLIFTADEFSEYYLPFLIALGPVLVWVAQKGCW